MIEVQSVDHVVLRVADVDTLVRSTSTFWAAIGIAEGPILASIISASGR